MSDHWRSLLYPLGFIASFFFFARMILQWVASEKRGHSHTPRLFWYLSLCGNALMALHTLVQIQFPICLMQASNGVIAWRHLRPRHPLWHVVCALILSCALICGLFFLQGFWNGSQEWIRTPVMPWAQSNHTEVSVLWPVIGYTGTSLFGMRFFLQWWYIERKKALDLGPLFWWASLIGTVMALSYFIRISDWVNILGYGTGIIPYARNLVLLRRRQQNVA